MKILVCVDNDYYNIKNVITYEFIAFVEVLRSMGYQVNHLNHVSRAKENKERFNEFFLQEIKKGYDLVVIVTKGNEFYSEVLDKAKEIVLTLAWNCDDDWRWEDYSSKLIRHFSYMVTTYEKIYAANKSNCSNLILSQWACTGLYDGFQSVKDIDVSFVGLGYGNRIRQVNFLRKKVGLVAYGKNLYNDNKFVRYSKRIISKVLKQDLKSKDLVMSDQTQVNGIWNRSKISFTPLDNSCGTGLQIKGRVFDMGLSGTVMLCNKHPEIYNFYEPGKEFLEFEDLGDCVDKIKFLLGNEKARSSIAKAYYERTKAEHLWSHRFNEIFKEIGVY